jgi:hypothetical protein
MLRLMVVGFECDPHRIGEILGLTPTVISRAGEISPNSGGRYRVSAWHIVIDRELRGGGDHDDALNELLGMVNGRTERFERLRNEVRPEKVTISGGFYLDPALQGGVWLDPPQMKTLSDCGIGWGLDFYPHADAKRLH